MSGYQVLLRLVLLVLAVELAQVLLELLKERRA